MLQPRGTTGALQRILPPRCGPYGRWANQDDRMGSRCHDESEVKGASLVRRSWQREEVTRTHRFLTSAAVPPPITWSPCSNPISYWIVQLPSSLPGPPQKKVAEHAQLPGTEAAICYPWPLVSYPRPAMVSPLTDAARAKKLSRPDARMALRGRCSCHCPSWNQPRVASTPSQPS